MKVKTIPILQLLLISIIFPCYLSAQKSCPIIPAPNNSKQSGNVFVLDNNTTIIYDDLYIAQASLLQTELLKQTGYAVSLSGVGNISTRIEIKHSENKLSEAYTIKMSDKEVLFEASTPQGMFNAVMSFMQLVRQAKSENSTLRVGCWDIEDSPQYLWRGFMLDESRHFFGKEKVKQILDWMAFYKMNRFHWHLTDGSGWRIEIKQYPKLALVGGIGDYDNPVAPAQYYSQEDIKEIVRYAAERFIVIIPEIDMPGHAAAANKAYPEYSGGGSEQFPEFTFNPGKDSTYIFLSGILKEVDALFPSQVIHIGGDEVHYGNNQWPANRDIKALMQKHKLKDIKHVETYFFHRMTDTIISKGNKVAAWDEVADADIAAGNVIVFWWRHDRTDQLQKALEKNFSIVMCPRKPFYLDYKQDSIMVYGPDHKIFPINSTERIYHFTPQEYGVSGNDRNKILGIQANLWTERVATTQRLDYMLFPRLAALAEAAWTTDRNDFEDFSMRLKQQFDLYKKDNIYYFNPFEPSLTGEPVK